MVLLEKLYSDVFITILAQLRVRFQFLLNEHIFHDFSSGNSVDI